MTYKLIHGDCLEELKKLPNHSVDSVVTDPPYGLSQEPDIREVLEKWLAGEDYTHRGGGFMGKTWDSFVPGPSVWREVYRVLKPGGHALVFAGTRTQDLMTISLRLAGFEIRDVIEWLYFSGFPKSLDVSKAIDNRAGAERKKVWRPYTKGSNAGNYDTHNSRPWIDRAREEGGRWVDTDEPVSALAQQWDGWGTALKPAHEPIIVARKPLDGTVAENVERWGTGAINVGGCRIGDDEIRSSGEVSNAWREIEGRLDRQAPNPSVNKGRFPANCVTTEPDAFFSKYFNVTPPELSKKASKKDRNSDWRGEEIGATNPHPTVKPTDLMAWLVRLVTPPGGIVLDPFAGSGSTLVAARRERFGFIGIEREAEYIEIAEARTMVTRTRLLPCNDGGGVGERGKRTCRG